MILKIDKVQNRKAYKNNKLEIIIISLPSCLGVSLYGSDQRCQVFMIFLEVSLQNYNISKQHGAQRLVCYQHRTSRMRIMLSIPGIAGTSDNR